MPTGDATRPPESVRPPHWAETVLRFALRPGDFETVSGDLLEEYRQSVYPSRGRRRADWWFVWQVGGFVGRATWVWGAAFATLMVGRDALDWFVPPVSFYTRSVVTSYTAISIFVGVGFWTTYRTRSLRASAFAGIATGLIAKVFGITTVLVLLAIWHDPQTMAAIERSGGLGEVLFPFPTVAGLVIATAVALVGGMLGVAVAWLVGPSRQGTAS
jgi:hypothetical protein